MNPSIALRPTFFWYPKDDVLETRELSCEAYGFYVRLREHCWAVGGVPARLDFLQRLAKNAFGLSRYKFTKLWTEVEKFFHEKDGTLESDCLGGIEDLSSKALQESHLRSQRARVAANTRWYAQTNRASVEHPSSIDSAFSPAGKEEVLYTPSITREVPAAASYAQASEAAGAAAHPVSTGLEPRIPPGYHEALSLRCVEIAVTPPDEALSAKIYKTHTRIPPNKFPLFPRQESSALWLHKTTQVIEIAIVQAEHPELTPRKPTKAEQNRAELIAWGKEQDRKAAEQ